MILFFSEKYVLKAEYVTKDKIKKLRLIPAMILTVNRFWIALMYWFRKSEIRPNNL